MDIIYYIADGELRSAGFDGTRGARVGRFRRIVIGTAKLTLLL